MAVITGTWQGTIKGTYQTATKVAGKPAPQKGFVWRRQAYTADLFRFVKDVATFTSIAGTNVAASTLSTKNGANTLTASGDPYLVTANDLAPDPPGSGIWKEIKIAVRYDDWEEWELNP